VRVKPLLRLRECSHCAYRKLRSATFTRNITLLHFICLADSPQFHRFIFLNVATFRRSAGAKK